MRNWRINLILILIITLAAAIIGRLVFLQIIKYDFYSALAQGQQKFFMNSQGERGEIFFQGYDLPIATNKTYFFAYVSPNEISSSDREEISKNLSEALNLDYNLVLEKLQKDSFYELIKNKIEEKEYNNLKAMNLPGLYFGKEESRTYPYGDFASHLLGFVNEDGEGQYGIEGYWDNFLKGKEEFLEGEKGPLGYFFSHSAGAGRGSDLILTIDYNIQYQAEKLLKLAANQLNTEGGTIIVVDPRSGQILALAEFPNFNPNEYSKEKDFSVFQSDAVQKVFEPGSVFKPITMAGALNEGTITPQTTYTDPGMIEIGGWPIYNYEQRNYAYLGQISMTQVLENSINTGAVFAESRLGHQKFLDYIEKFGISEKTGIDLEGESLPQNNEFKQGREINFATASFGQGIEMTPIQLLEAYMAIANNGARLKPYLVEEIKNGDNGVIETKPEVVEKVISPETAAKLTAMLVSVVENGFGKAAKIPGYYIAGKTGTAQMSFAALNIDKEGYSDKTWQSFIGFAPAFNPRFLIFVKLNNPATKTAEYSAIPIFKELAKYIIDYHQIPPDYAQ